MLQLPPVKAAAPQPQAQSQPTASPDSSEQGTAFADVLDTVGSGLPPAELRAEVQRQVSDGMPLDEVLDNLVQRLEDESEQPLEPAMMPVLSAVVQEAAAPAGDLSGELVTGAGGTKAGLSDQLSAVEEAFFGSDGDGDGVKTLEQLLGKEKVTLVGRMNLAEAGNAIVQAPPLRPLELPHSLASALPGPATSQDGAMLNLPPKVGEAGWGQAMAQRVMWMVGREQQTAEIRLNPAHLGPLEVKLSLHHDQASVSLLAHNGAVRDALEQALPRLRDMFNQQDIQLVQVDVGQRQDPRGGQADANPSGQQAAHGNTGANGIDGVGDEPVTEMVKRHSLGLLDAYA